MEWEKVRVKKAGKVVGEFDTKDLDVSDAVLNVSFDIQCEKCKNIVKVNVEMSMKQVVNVIALLLAFLENEVEIVELGGGF